MVPKIDEDSRIMSEAEFGSLDQGAAVILNLVNEALRADGHEACESIHDGLSHYAGLEKPDDWEIIAGMRALLLAVVPWSWFWQMAAIDPGTTDKFAYQAHGRQGLHDPEVYDVYMQRVVTILDTQLACVRSSKSA